MERHKGHKEIVTAGKKIYEKEILTEIGENHKGEYVAIDVTSGKWTIAKTTLEAMRTLREKHPEATEISCERVGFRATRSMRKRIPVGLFK